MRPILLCAALLSFSPGCGEETPEVPPPADRFYFPAGLHHAALAGEPGTLYVASANFDKRYAFGALTALDLSALSLPFPTYLGGDSEPQPSAAPQVLTELGLTDENRVVISSFAGLFDATAPDAEGALRLFVPTRAEGDNVFPIDARGARLSCVGADDPQAGDCLPHALSLTRGGAGGAEGFELGTPRAPEPYSTTVDASGRVWVSHLRQADSPLGSGKNFESYLVRLQAEDPQVGPESFLPIGPTPSTAVAVGPRYAFLSGRAVRGGFAPLRLLDLTDPARPPLDVGVQAEFRMLDVRDLLLSADGRRVFLLGRSPDVLLVLSVDDPEADLPRISVVRSVPLPESPTQLRALPRPGGAGTLLAITCTGAGALALYDDDTGQLAAVETGLLEQPFGVAIHAPAGAVGARLFVGGFGDGKIAVLDLPDLAAPAQVVRIGMLGQDQRCITEGPGFPGCPGEGR